MPFPTVSQPFLGDTKVHLRLQLARIWTCLAVPTGDHEAATVLQCPVPRFGAQGVQRGDEEYGGLGMAGEPAMVLGSKNMSLNEATCKAYMPDPGGPRRQARAAASMAMVKRNTQRRQAGSRAATLRPHTRYTPVSEAEEEGEKRATMKR